MIDIDISTAIYLYTLTDIYGGSYGWIVWMDRMGRIVSIRTVDEVCCVWLSDGTV